jgi:hypothetical protein
MAATEGKTLKSVSACHLARSIDAVAGTLQMVTHHRDGSILLEARTDQEIEKLFSLTAIEGLRVQVVTYPALSLCKGVVNHDNFSSEREEDLKAVFEQEEVVDIHRIQRRVDRRLVPTSTLVLAFNRPSLPERIICGFLNLRV